MAWKKECGPPEGISAWSYRFFALCVWDGEGAGAAREKPELSSLKGGLRKEAPTTWSRLGTITNLLRGFLATCVFLLLTGAFYAAQSKKFMAPIVL